MPRQDFNLGNEVRLDLVRENGTLMNIGGLVGFDAKQVSSFVSSKRLTENGRKITRTVFDGWEGTFEFDRSTNAVDNIASLLEQNYFSGGKEIYFQIMQTLRNPETGAVNQYQFEQVSIAPESLGNFKADDRVQQTMKFTAVSRTILA